jgi:hypothetical protein
VMTWTEKPRVAARLPAATAMSGSKNYAARRDTRSEVVRAAS